MALCPVILLADRSDPHVDAVACLLETALADVVTFLPQDSKDATFALAIGGDGTMITHGRTLASSNTPLIGVNSGRLGFLAKFDAESLIAQRDVVFSDNHTTIDIMLLDIAVDDASPVVAMNEALIAAGPPFQILELGLSIDDVPAPTLRCDGIIVSTPSGSTAHNASVGGPIVDPSSNSFVLTPLAAHSLAVRPIVLDGKAKISVEILQANEGTSLVIDGKVQCTLKEGMKLHVQRSSHTLSVVLNPSCSYWNALVDKLHWAAQPAFQNNTDP